MHNITKAIISLTKTFKNLIKHMTNKIKIGLVKAFSPIFKLLYKILKGILLGLKLFFLYIFIKPILFLYHHLVQPIGKALCYAFAKAFSFIVKPTYHFLKFLFKKIHAFICYIYNKIFRPFINFFSFIFKQVGLGAFWIIRKIYQLILYCAKLVYKWTLKPIFTFLYYLFFGFYSIFKFFFLKICLGISKILKILYRIFTSFFQFLYSKLLYPIYLVFKFIFKKLFHFFKWLGNKIIRFFSLIIHFIYRKILRPIGIFLKFLFQKVWFSIQWFFIKLYHLISIIVKFIFYKILNPIYIFLKFIISKIVLFFKKTGILIWGTLKFLYQTISVIIVVTLSTLICIGYTWVIYPFKIILELRNIVRKKEISFFQLIMLHPYYVCKAIKEKNESQLIKHKEKQSELTIFIQMKNIIAIIPMILYGLILYPLNWLLILLLYPFFHK